MVATAIPTSDINTHHMTLSDGLTTLGLILCDAYGNPIKGAIEEQASPATALQVSNSGGGYDNYLQPYSPTPQVDWSGGLGIEYADQDMTRYAEGYACDTSLGKIMPAGEASYNPCGPTASVTLAAGTSGDTRTSFFWSITPGALALKRIDVFVETDRACRVSWTLRVTNDVSGPGGTVDTIAVASGTWELTADNYGGSWQKINVVASLSAATKYWFCLEGVSATNGATVSLAYNYSLGENIVYFQAPSWVTLHANNTYSHNLYAATQDGFRFFIYRNQIYAVTVSSDGSAVRLYQGGWRGAAAANAGRMLEYLVDGTLPISASGATAILIAGPGSREEYNYRNSGTATGGNLRVSPPWRITHTTSTEYVATPVSSMAPWPEVTGHGLTGPITDVCVVDDRVYFCQANAANIRRMVYTTSGGHAWTDEGAQADFLEMFTDTDGKKRIFMAVAESSLVYKCEVGAAMGTRTQVNNSLPVGSSDSWITNLGIYDDPQRPFILKEDGFGSISSDVYGPIPISNAMGAVRSRQNGRAWCTNDRFLYFSMGEKLLRYYSGDLRNIGPDLDQGLPSERRGNISAIVAYPGGVIYAAIDAGAAGYSSVLKYGQNGSGWCEVWRAPFGDRITNLIIQNIPGLQYQYLHIGCGDNIYRIPIASNPLQASGFRFAASCSLTTGWFRTGYKDINKFWNAVKLFLVNNSAARTALVEYRTNTNTSWSTLGTYTAAAPSQEIEFNATTTIANDITGVRIQLRITLTTNSATTPVYVEQMVLQAVTRVPTKKAWVITARIFDQSHNLRGDMDNLSAADIKTILEGWGNSEVNAKRLLVRSGDFSVWDQKRAFIEPISYKPLKADAVGARRVGLLARFRLVEA